MSGAMDQEALNDLNALLSQAAGDSELQAQIANELGELIRKLPHDAVLDVDDTLLLAAINKDFAVVIDQAGAYLNARLSAGRR